MKFPFKREDKVRRNPAYPLKKEELEMDKIYTVSDCLYSSHHNCFVLMLRELPRKHNCVWDAAKFELLTPSSPVQNTEDSDYKHTLKEHERLLEI